MDGHLYSAAYLVILGIGLASVLMVVLNTLGMIFHVHPRREKLSQFVVPLLLLPGMFTEQGARYRRRFWLYLLLTACCFGTLIALERAYGKPPYMDKLNAQSSLALPIQLVASASAADSVSADSMYSKELKSSDVVRTES